MLAISGNVLLLWAALLAGGTPCGEPPDAAGGTRIDARGRLCAPIPSITSGPSAPRAAAPEPDPAWPLEENAPHSAPLPARGRDSAPLVRIGLLLPLRSATLGPPAEALRAGFMAAYEREPDGLIVSLVETGGAAREVLASYAEVQEQQDIIVGPLARAAVTALAASALVYKPTIALNHPEGLAPASADALPPAMLMIGLSLEEEARQVAAWAASEQPQAHAVIVAGGAPWQRRIAQAYAAECQRIGMAAQTVELSTLNGNLSEAELEELDAIIQEGAGESGAAPALLLAALDADQARQLRAVLGNGISLYGTSSLNPGHGAGAMALDGTRLLDLPWLLQPDHPAVMTYARPEPARPGERNADMERLYALGIDAFRIAREIALHPAARFELDGVTGRLSVSFGQGPARFERAGQAAIYENGELTPLGAPSGWR
jgi:outer membrane PBP1 activator LpoA protein